MSTTCLLSLVYCGTFLVFEILIWSIAVIPSNYLVEDIPADNLLELLRYVDPGDNPFTFPRLDPSPPSIEGPSVELAPIPAASAASGSLATGRNPTPVQSETHEVPWDTAIPIIAAITAAIGISLWAFVLRDIWGRNKAVFMLAISALAFWAIRLLAKWLLRYHGLRFSGQTTSGRLVRDTLNQLKTTALKNFGLGSFFIGWFWVRLTTVNVFSGIWLTAISLYFTHTFSEGAQTQPAKPRWLDWLG